MMQALAVGLVGGIASAVLYIAAFSGGFLGMLLLLVAPLPILLAGLGWGPRSAASAAICGIAVAAADAFSGDTFAIVEPLSFAALISIPSAIYATIYGAPIEFGPLLPGSKAPSAPRPQVSFLSIGFVLTLIALGTFVSLIATGAIVGWSSDSVRQSLEAAVTSIASSTPGLPPLSDEELHGEIEFYQTLLPLVFSSFWFIVIILNLSLANRITALSGQLARVGEDVAATLRIPTVVAAVLILCFAGGFLAGLPGTVARVACGAFFAMTALDGLAIIHLALRGRPARLFVLGFLYALMAFTLFPMLPLGLIGLVDIVYPLRGRIKSMPPRPKLPPTSKD